MAESKMNATPDRIVERNIVLTGQFTRYLLENPAIFSALPDAFELVIFPQNDPELQIYNLRLWEKFGREGKSVVLAHLGSASVELTTQTPPQIYVPIAA